MHTLLHVDLVVQAIERSLPFYVDALGFTVVEDSTVEGEVPRFLSDGRHDSVRLVFLQSTRFGAMVELLEFPGEQGDTIGKTAERGDDPLRPSGCGTGLSSISFLVDDMGQVVTRLESRGVSPLTDPLRVDLPRLGTSSVVFVQDPDGNRIELVEVT